MQNLFLFLICIAVGAIASHYAKQRGRNHRAWFVIGFLFGILGLLILFLLPSKKRSTPISKPAEPPAPAPHPYFQKSLLETIDPAHSEKLWYYLDQSHEQLGPMSLTALSHAWKQGKVSEKTFVWNENLENWKHFEQVLKPIA
ncbi:MAG: DUF4339 domain-containing protein [Rhabdochlamydiaceae bacterium]|nr:DUF4339 domain-containing protein [Rhabdochlamydiaceae bacterium]